MASSYSDVFFTLIIVTYINISQEILYGGDMSQFTFSNAVLDGGVNSEPSFHQASNDNGMNNDNGMSNDPTGGMFAASELNAPEYSTDDFRMFSFKVSRCGKRFVHDWRSCPFAHPTENARRRDPRVARYLPVPCPDYKRGICMRGDACPYSHGVYECWLHPAKYRTQLCKEGPACRRPVCFFAHSVADLRQPTHVWTAGGELQPNQRSQPTTAAGALLSATGNGPDCSEAQNMNVACHLQSAAEEALNNANVYGNGSALMDGNVHGGVHNHVLNPQTSINNSSSGTARSALHRNVEMSPVQPRAASLELRHPSGGGGGVNSSINNGPDRLSLDAGMMSMQQTNPAPGQQSTASNQQSNWAHSLAASASAAVALNGIPVNEQPLLSNHGPRMSNAVARKLGLAPGKGSATEPVANTNSSARSDTNANANANANATGSLSSSSGSGSGSTSLLQSDSETQMLPLPQVPPHHQHNQQTHNRPVSMDGFGIQQPHSAGQGGTNVSVQPRRHSLHYPLNPDLNYLFDYENGGNASMGMATAASNVHTGYSLPATSDALGIHPALLNLVAAHLTGVTSAGSSGGHDELFDMNGNGNSNGNVGGNSDAGLASIMEVMSRWGLGGHPNEQRMPPPTSSGGTAMMNTDPGHSISYPHRSSSDGVLGPSSSLPGPSPNPFMLPVDLVDLMGTQQGRNNSDGNSTGCQPER